MINNKHLCDGNYIISVYSKPSSDTTMYQETITRGRLHIKKHTDASSVLEAGVSI
jgi:hypothetical protein